MKSKPVITIKANADGISVSRNGKPEKRKKFVSDWARFRATLPTQLSKEEK